MSKNQEEIADLDAYVQQNLSKIDNVHGSLQAAVTQRQVKKETVDYLKERFESLRSALRKKLLSERKLVAETAELVSEIRGFVPVDYDLPKYKKEKEEMKKLEKESTRDQEMIAIISEDADQADSEAVMAKENVDKLLMESVALERIREQYKKGILEIKREHVLALEPVLARLKQDIKLEGEEFAERTVKMNQHTNEIEDKKVAYMELLVDITGVKGTIEEQQTKSAGLEGVPERLKKQGDILLVAVKSLRAQLRKWVTKVGEMNNELHSFQVAIKEKMEEIAHAILHVSKMELHAEQQERVARDMAKDLEVAKADVDGYLDDQVYLDLQILSKASDLKHEQEMLSNRVKERDRALTTLQEIQAEVESLQSQIPNLKQEKKKVHRELVLAEIERKTFEAHADNLRKDIEICMSTFLAVEDDGKEISYQLRESNATVQRLEADVVVCITEERQREHQITELINVRERFSRAASVKYSLWRQTVEKIEVEENFIRSFHKRLKELQKRHEEELVLYNVIRSQRNKYINLFRECKISIAEMRDRVDASTREVELLQEDVLYKVQVLDKMHQQYLQSLKDCTLVRDDISNCNQFLSKKMFVLEEIEVEEKRLEENVRKRERNQVKTHGEYVLWVKDRNTIGLSLIDRNDELCIFYEKSNVQVKLLEHSEFELAKRIDEVALLRLACKLTHDSVETTQRSAPDPDVIYKEFNVLKEKLLEAKLQVDQLSELCENPIRKTQRWHLLPGRDLEKRDLDRKAEAITELLGAREDQSTEKDVILEEVTEIADDVMRRAALNMEGSVKINKTFNEHKRNMIDVSRSMFATISELALTQATAMSLKQEREAAGKQLDEAVTRLAAGEPPTDDTNRELEYLEREAQVVLKLELARQAFQLEEQIYIQSQHCATRPKTTPITTAEQRANAYFAPPMGLPVPFGVHYPFRPATRGSTIRHIRKPHPPPAQLPIKI